VIIVDGDRWGTAAEIAAHIGHGVTPATVRSWAARDGLASVRMTDDDGRPQVRYLLDQAQRIDRQKRHGRLGRPRAA